MRYAVCAALINIILPKRVCIHWSCLSHGRKPQFLHNCGGREVRMSFVLFVLGLVASAAGVLMVGFGIPINEFSLGNTLIMAGTTALAGGLIVLGLAVISRQLGKIADLLGRADRPVEIYEAAPASRMAPRPAPSPEPPARAPSFPERPFTPAPMEMSDDPDFEPVRLDRPGG